MFSVNIARESKDKLTTSVRMSSELRVRLSAISKDSGISVTNLVVSALWDLVDKYGSSLDKPSNRD